MILFAACGDNESNGGASGDEPKTSNVASRPPDGKYEIVDAGSFRLSGVMLNVLYFTIDGDEIVIVTQSATALGNNQRRTATLDGNKFTISGTEYEILKESNTVFTIGRGRFEKAE
jgi:hypothetical protein